MKRISLLFLLVSLLTVNTAFGAATNNNGNSTQISPAAGADMWTAAMADLFIPHPNTCDPLTEAFVQILPNGKGFCIEIDERPAKEWTEARHTCLQEGKRLPELGELQYVCNHNNQYGILGAESNKEWSSNFLLIGDDASRTARVTVAAFGSGSCNDVSAGLIGRDSFGNSPQSLSFRCVR